jgi:hypothetical protein
MANGYGARSDKHQGGFKMWFIPLAAEVCKIAIAAIILYFVVEMITPMPGWARQVVQLLIVLLAILAVISLFAGPSHAGAPLTPLGLPSICKNC